MKTFWRKLAAYSFNFLTSVPVLGLDDLRPELTTFFGAFAFGLAVVSGVKYV